MKKSLLILCMLLPCIFTTHAQDNKLISKAQLKGVTVYSAGAEMNHTVSFPLKKGNNELLITNISTNIDVNSVQVKSPGTVTVLSVEFTNKYIIPTEKSPKVKSLEDSITQIQHDINNIKISIQNNHQLQKILDNNQTLKAPQNDLNVSELTKLVDYYKNKSTEVQRDILTLTEKQAKLEEKIATLNKRIQEERQNEAISGGRLIVKVSALIAGNADFSFSYITPNANWIPAYDIRVNNVKEPIQLAFKAKVSQQTGIDWKQVKLNLSTSTPSQYGVAPTLNQWFLYYIQPHYMYDEKILSNSIQASHKEVYMEAESLKQMAEVGDDYGVQRKAGIGSQIPPIYVVNGEILNSSTYAEINPSLIKSSYFMQAQQAKATYGDVAAGGAYIVSLKTDIEDYVNVAENTMNTVFEIDLPYDITSNGQSQTIQVQTKEIPAIYKHYAVPKLDPEAFLLAEIPNWNQLNLLPGEASIIFENTYVGKTHIDPASTADTFNLTIGKDKRIVIKRQKMEDFSSSKFMGSTKTQKFTYEITVKNNKTEAVHFMLKDQFPLSSMKEVEIELLESGDAVVNKEIGVLTWHMNLAAGESKKVRFVYSVKYPKDKELNLEN